MVEAGLEADPRRGEGVVDQPGPPEPVLLGVRDGVVDHRRKHEWVGDPEVRDRLPRRNHRQLDLDSGEQGARPGARGHDARARREDVALRGDAHGAVTELEPGHPLPIENDRPGCDGRGEEGRMGLVGTGDASVRLKENILGRAGCDRPAG